MKKILFTLATVLSLTLSAQITQVTSGFTQNLTKADIPFSGDRKLYSTGLNDSTTENIFVVSKNQKGAASDELWLEKFTKKGSGYVRTYSHQMTHPVNLSLAFVNNRASYGDIDKDGNYESLSVVDEYSNGPDTDLERSNGVIMYKNEAYVVYVDHKDNFTENHFSTNFSKLPESVKASFLEFWNSLDKR